MQASLLQPGPSLLPEASEQQLVGHSFSSSSTPVAYVAYHPHPPDLHDLHTSRVPWQGAMVGREIAVDDAASSISMRSSQSADSDRSNASDPSQPSHSNVQLTTGRIAAMPQAPHRTLQRMEEGKARPYQPQQCDARRRLTDGSVRHIVLTAGEDPLDQVRPSSRCVSTTRPPCDASRVAAGQCLLSADLIPQPRCAHRYVKPPWSWGQYSVRSEQIRVESGVELCEGPRATGQYVERARNMQAAALQHPEARLGGSLASIEWPLLPIGGAPTLRLSGPAHAMQSFLHLVKRCQAAVGEQHVREAEQLGTRILWPIFVLSHGRARTAHLNWAAPHVLGTAAKAGGSDSGVSLGGEAPDVGPASHPVVVVVNPEEVDEYRRHWPTALILALPEEGQPVGYARFIVKRAVEWRSPFFWVCDDNVNAFVKVEVGADGRARRHTEGALFREALLHVQRHECISAIALAGFLRSDGTEVSKRHSELRGSVKIYKVLLHNSRQCAGLEYVPALTKFEDVAFVRLLLLRGRTTLKVQTYAYRAVNTKAGGCAASRAAASDDLVHAASASKMSATDWCVVARLREWITRDLHKSMPARLRHPESCKRRRTLGRGGDCKSGISLSDRPDDGNKASSEKREATAAETEVTVSPQDNWAPPSCVTRRIVPAREELIGSRIRVWWEDDNRWYAGRVHNYSRSRGHFVVYDDDDRIFENLCEARWLYEHDVNSDSDEERPLRERRRYPKRTRAVE